MENHYQYSDEEFETLFKNCEFPSKLFNHEAHLRLAWIHISKYGCENAVSNICYQLKIYVRGLNAEEKYNETLTIAAVKAVYHFYLRTNADDFSEFIRINFRLKTNFKDLMAQHYSTDIFNSAEAKNKYLKPEILAFD